MSVRKLEIKRIGGVTIVTLPKLVYKLLVEKDMHLKIKAKGVDYVNTDIDKDAFILFLNKLNKKFAKVVEPVEISKRDYKTIKKDNKNSAQTKVLVKEIKKASKAKDLKEPLHSPFAIVKGTVKLIDFKTTIPVAVVELYNKAENKSSIENYLYWCMLQINPVTRLKLFGFLLNHSNMITEDGLIIGYRKVKKVNETTFTDNHSHSARYCEGSIFKMNRRNTDERNDVECSRGLHFGTKDFNYGSFGDTFALVLVNPAHIVAMPYEDSHKVRACQLYFAKISISTKDIKDFEYDIKELKKQSFVVVKLLLEEVKSCIGRTLSIKVKNFLRDMYEDTNITHTAKGDELELNLDATTKLISDRLKTVK